MTCRQFFTTLIIVLIAITGYAQPNIDLDWATYYGGNDDDLGFSVTIDKSGNTCIVGRTGSANNISTTGSFLDTLPAQPPLGGSFVAYFNKSGTRQWATYYKDWIHDVTFDSTGNIYITGVSDDTSAATSGTHQDSLWGVSDAYITKFSATGTRLWTTYFGGELVDGGSSIAITSDNKIILAGYTTSTMNIADSFAHQSTIYDSSDYFIAKFDTTGNKIWSSYYGGTGREYSMDIFFNPCVVTLDNKGNIFFAGSTTSNANIATPGAHIYSRRYKGQSINPAINLSWGIANTDAFLVKFDENGARQWATYFGDSSTELNQGIACDLDGNVYISGFTDSKNGIATTSAHQTSFNSIAAYLAKFDAAGNLEWATYHGDTLIYYFHNPIAISFDGNRHVYLTSLGRSNMSTANSPQPTALPSIPVATVAFDENGNRVWGTYLGGYGQNAITDVCTYKNRIAIAGITLADSLLATTGAHQNTYGGNNPAGGGVVVLPAGDAYLYQYELKDTNVFISSAFVDSVLCPAVTSMNVPYEVTRNFNANNTFTVQLSNATGSFASPTNIGSSNTNTQGSISCTVPGTITAGRGYRIRIVASSPADTSESRKVNVRQFVTPSLQLIAYPQDTVCSTDTTTSVLAVLNNPGIDNQYTWRLNGQTLGITGSAYYSDTFKNGDVIICNVASNIHCMGSLYTSADTITIAVDTPVSTVITIGIAPNDTLCIDTAFIFPTSIVNGGISRSYQWYDNFGLMQGETNDTLLARNFFSHDEFYCVITNNDYCVAERKDTSNTIKVVTKNSSKANVVIQASPGTTVPMGTDITFTANFTNKGSAPEYQWMKNGVDVSGAISDNYYAISSTISNGDMISVRVRDTSDQCLVPNMDTSNVLTLSITNGISRVNSSEGYLSLYPSPNNGSFILKASATSSQAQVRVINLLGQPVYNNIIPIDKGTIDHNIELPAKIPQGVYLLQLTENGVTRSARFVVKK